MLTPSPVSEHLYLFGGEYYDGQTVELYADVSFANLNFLPFAFADSFSPPYSDAAVSIRSGKERMEEVHVAYSTWSEISSSNGRYSCWRWKVSRITLFMHNSRDAHIGKFSHRIWIFGGEFCKFRNRSIIAPDH